MMMLWPMASLSAAGLHNRRWQHTAARVALALPRVEVGVFAHGGKSRTGSMDRGFGRREREREREFFIKQGVIGATSQCLCKPFAADLVNDSQTCTSVSQSSVCLRIACSQVVQSDVCLNTYLIPV